MKQKTFMKGRIIFSFLFLLSFFSISLVEAPFGYDNPNLPKVTRDLLAVITFDNITGSINSSDFWDNLNTPADINAADITDDNTYVTISGDNMTGNLTAQWFNGLFNWTEDSIYLSFDGSTLSFSEFNLNTTIGIYNDSMKSYVDSQDTIFNNSIVNWIDSLFPRFTELVGQIGNWTLDQVNYYTKTEVTANITNANTSAINWVVDQIYVMNNTNGWNVNFTTLQADNYLTDSGTFKFNYYDDGSEFFWNLTSIGDAINFITDNSKIVLFNSPVAGNDFKVFQVFSKEAQDTTEFVITKAKDQLTSYFVRSLALVGNGTAIPTPHNCSTFANFIDCKTDVTGPDFYVLDDVEINGSLYVADGNFRVNDDGNVTGNFFFGDGSLLTGISVTETDPLWTANQSNYFTKINILSFNYYNSTDFSIGDYLTSSQILGFNYYNSTDFDISNYPTLTEIIAFGYYNSSDFSISDYYTKTNINNFGYYNSTDFSISDYVPYTGANTNLDLGDNNFSVDSSVFFVNSNTNRIGIGTSSPGSLLHVADVVSGLSSPAAPGIIITDDLAPSLYFEDTGEASGKKVFRITTFAQGLHIQSMTDNGLNSDTLIASFNRNGTVGIGTTNPRYKLEIADTTSTGVPQIAITGVGGQLAAVFGDSASGTNEEAGVLGLHDDGVLKVYLRGVTGGDSYFNTGGNVGIGTDSPAMRLDVRNVPSGNSLAPTAFDASFQDGTGYHFFGINSGDLVANKNYYGLYSVARVENSGAPSSGHSIYAGKFEASNSYGGGVNVYALRTVGDVHLMNGDVGIGTTNPGLRLEVENTGSTNVLRVQDSSNTCSFGVDGSGWASISCSSDEKLKKDITDVPYETINKIANWIFNYPLKEFTIRANNERQIGVIAQDIQLLNPSKVRNITEVQLNSTYFDNKTNQTINTYINKTYLAVDVPSTIDFIIAIQELKQENDLLKSELCLARPTYSWCLK